MSPRSMAAIVSPPSGRGVTPSMHLSRDHCSALRERMGMDCLVSLMRSVLLIALMLDCGGRRESEKGSEGEGGRWGERKSEREREC